MAEPHFEPADVARLIPELTRILDDLMAVHRQAVALRERRQAEQQRVALAGGALIDRERWAADDRTLEELTGRLQAGLERVQRLGGVVKDLALGLVDFPHRRGGRTVNLCWKHGEREVGYWHGLDEGYANRKPL